MEHEKISYYVHEGMMVRMERTIKRLWILCIIIFLAFVASNAAYLTIKEHLYPQVVENDSSAIPVYSYAEPPSVEYTGDSVFSQSVSGKDMTEVWKIMDELMDTLQVIQPRLYDSVIRKIDSI